MHSLFQSSQQVSSMDEAGSCPLFAASRTGTAKAAESTDVRVQMRVRMSVIMDCILQEQ